MAALLLRTLTKGACAVANPHQICAEASNACSLDTEVPEEKAISCSCRSCQHQSHCPWHIHWLSANTGTQASWISYFPHCDHLSLKITYQMAPRVTLLSSLDLSSLNKVSSPHLSSFELCYFSGDSWPLM